MQPRAHYLTTFQTNITSPLSSIPKADPSPSQPTHPGPSSQLLNASSSLTQSSTEQHRAAHPPEAQTDCMGTASILGGADGAFETLRARLREATCSCRLCARPVSRLPARKLFRSVPPVAHHTPPHPNQTKQPINTNSRANKQTPSHLLVKQRQTPPSIPTSRVCSIGAHARQDAVLVGCVSVLSHRLLGIGAERAVPGPGGVVGQGRMWVRDGGEGSVRCWCDGGGG